MPMDVSSQRKPKKLRSRSQDSGGALRALLHAKAIRREHLSPKTIREIAGVLSVSLNEASVWRKFPSIYFFG
jgi:hypothetical protein